MRCTVYRCLDRSLTVFGIRGRFAWLALPCTGAALVAGLVAGSLLGTLAGAGTALVLLLAGWALTIRLQAGRDGKDFWKILARRALPAAWRLRPAPVRNLWRGAGAGLPAED